ncbi:MAG: heavy-metal-associated domain-containing protein [Synergistales bacterium]|nr:heavy-metal-associated domain-containing protein [Synergistales bacterium]
MQTLVIDVPDMSCDHCVNRIGRALEEAGYPGAQVDLAGKTVTVAAGDENAVLALLDDTGYPSTVKERR